MIKPSRWCASCCDARLANFSVGMWFVVVLGGLYIILHPALRNKLSRLSPWVDWQIASVTGVLNQKIKTNFASHWARCWHKWLNHATDISLATGGDALCHLHRNVCYPQYRKHIICWVLSVYVSHNTEKIGQGLNILYQLILFHCFVIKLFMKNYITQSLEPVVISKLISQELW